MNILKNRVSLPKSFNSHFMPLSLDTIICRYLSSQRWQANSANSLVMEKQIYSTLALASNKSILNELIIYFTDNKCNLRAKCAISNSE